MTEKTTSNEANSTPSTPSTPSATRKGLNNLGFVLGLGATLAIGWYGGSYLKKLWGEKYGASVTLEEGDRYLVELRGDEPQIGPDDALITVVTFSDFECPYCAKAEPPLEAMVEAYKGKVRVIFKHYPLPFHKNAIPAAKAAWAAQQQDQFWPMHDWLFENRGNLMALTKDIESMGIDEAQWQKDYISPEAGLAVDSDRMAGGRVGVGGTPAFFVNGHPYQGFKTESQWSDIIDYELKAAENVDAPASEVYGKLMEGAKKTRGGGGKRSQKRRAGMPDPAKIYRAPVDGRMQKGPDDAAVTIIEFTDFDCPFCQRADVVIQEMLAAYPEDVRVVVRQRPLPMHKFADEAAKAVIAARKQGKEWEMYELMFAKNPKNMDQLKVMAADIGINAEQMQADMEDSSTLELMAEDAALAKGFGINGTPAFFVNGRFLSGAQGSTVFRTMIDEEIAKAKASDVPAEQYYHEITKAGLTEVKD